MLADVVSTFIPYIHIMLLEYTLLCSSQKKQEF
jgi:preprotein translocase subunit YajC